MTLNNSMLSLSMRTKLSTLWTFFLFNVIFRDLHEMVEPGFIQEIMTGTFNGSPITEELMLLGGFMVEVPIAMVLLSRLLPYGANRLANLMAGTVVISLALIYGVTDLDDTFFLIVEIIALSYAMWLAWRWKKPSLKRYSPGQEA